MSFDRPLMPKHLIGRTGNEDMYRDNNGNIKDKPTNDGKTRLPPTGSANSSSTTGGSNDTQQSSFVSRYSHSDTFDGVVCSPPSSASGNQLRCEDQLSVTNPSNFDALTTASTIYRRPVWGTHLVATSRLRSDKPMPQSTAAQQSRRFQKLVRQWTAAGALGATSNSAAAAGDGGDHQPRSLDSSQPECSGSAMPVASPCHSETVTSSSIDVAPVPLSLFSLIDRSPKSADREYQLSLDAHSPTILSARADSEKHSPNDPVVIASGEALNPHGSRSLPDKGDIGNVVTGVSDNQSPRFVRKPAYSTGRHGAVLDMSTSVSPIQSVSPSYDASNGQSLTVSSSPCQLLPAAPSPLPAVSSISEPKVTHLPRHRRSSTFHTTTVASADISEHTDALAQDLTHNTEVLSKFPASSSPHNATVVVSLSNEPDMDKRKINHRKHEHFQRILNMKSPPPSLKSDLTYVHHQDFRDSGAHREPIRMPSAAMIPRKPIAAPNPDIFNRAGKAYQLIESTKRQLNDAIALQRQGCASKNHAQELANTICRSQFSRLSELGYGSSVTSAKPPRRTLNPDTFLPRETMKTSAATSTTTATASGVSGSTDDKIAFQESSTYNYPIATDPSAKPGSIISANVTNDMPPSGMTTSLHYPVATNAGSSGLLSRRSQFRIFCPGIRSHRSDAIHRCLSDSFRSRRCLCRILTLDSSNDKFRPWKEYYMCISGTEVRFVKASSAHFSANRLPKSAGAPLDNTGNGNGQGNLLDFMSSMPLDTRDTQTSSDFTPQHLASVSPKLTESLPSSLVNSTKSFTLPIVGLVWYPTALPADLPQSWSTSTTSMQLQNDQTSVEIPDSPSVSSDTMLPSSSNPRCYYFIHSQVGCKLLFVFPDESTATTCLRICELYRNQSKATFHTVPKSASESGCHTSGSTTSSLPVAQNSGKNMSNHSQGIHQPLSPHVYYSRTYNEHSLPSRSPTEVPSLKDNRQRFSNWNVKQRATDKSGGLVDASSQSVISFDGWSERPKQTRSPIFGKEEKLVTNTTSILLNKRKAFQKSFSVDIANGNLTTTVPRLQLTNGESQTKSTRRSSKTGMSKSVSSGRSTGPFLRGIKQWLNRPSISSPSVSGGASSSASINTNTLSRPLTSLQSDTVERRIASVFDNPPDFSEWDTPGPVFGAPLETQLESPKYQFVPVILHAFVVALEAHGLGLRGLYRKPGRHRTIAQFVCTVNQAPHNLDLLLKLDAWNEPNALCGLVKLFLRRLPVGLFHVDTWEPLAALVPTEPVSSKATVSETSASPVIRQFAYLLLSIRVRLKKMLAEIFCSGELENHQEFSTMNANSPVVRLPVESSAAAWRWSTLQFLVNHLLEVVSYYLHNEVSYQCVAICFGPVFFENSSQLTKLNEVLEHLFCHWKWLTTGLSLTSTERISDPTLLDAIDYVVGYLNSSEAQVLDSAGALFTSDSTVSDKTSPAHSLDPPTQQAVREPVRALLQRAYVAAGVSCSVVREDGVGDYPKSLPLRNVSNNTTEKHWNCKTHPAGLTIETGAMGKPGHKSLAKMPAYSDEPVGYHHSPIDNAYGDQKYQLPDNVTRMRRKRRTAPPRTLSLHPGRLTDASPQSTFRNEYYCNP